MASLSNIIAILFPIFLLVARPNLCDPSLSSEKATIGSLLRLSYLGCASIKFSPLKIILLRKVRFPAGFFPIERNLRSPVVP